jgi:spore maturation protein CgeB
MTNRDLELIDICNTEKPDLAIFAKTNTIHPAVFESCKKVTKVCYWFPDPLKTYENPEFLGMTEMADFFCCDKKNVAEYGSKFNKKSYCVPDGFDPELEKPRDLEKDIDVSFIGSLHSDRKEKIEKISKDVVVVSDAFGEKHSEIVSRSKINLNFCTTMGASDRTYKVLAAGGFYLTDDWAGRDEKFIDGTDLVIYKDIDDLNKKIEYYLNNDISREKIAKSGKLAVEKFSRYAWAKRIVEIFCELYPERNKQNE